MKQVYHVTVGGHGNNTIYKNDDDRILYLHCLESSVEKYKPEVLSFAVLTNHSHFLFFCERQIITKTLYHINRRYAYIIKNKYNISEKIFNTSFSFSTFSIAKSAVRLTTSSGIFFPI